MCGEAQSCRAPTCDNNYWGLSVFRACFLESAALSVTQGKEAQKSKLGKYPSFDSCEKLIRFAAGKIYNTAPAARS